MQIMSVVIFPSSRACFWVLSSTCSFPARCKHPVSWEVPWGPQRCRFPLRQSNLASSEITHESQSLVTRSVDLE